MDDIRDRATEAIQSSDALLIKQAVQIEALRDAATRWPRCCDRWQDSLGGMHCKECAQKTFAMMRNIQAILGVGKDGRPLAVSKGQAPGGHE